MFVPLEIILVVFTVLFVPGVIYIWKQQNKKIEELKTSLEKHVEKADERLDKQDERMSEIENNYKDEFKLVREALHSVRDQIMGELSNIKVSCAAFSHHPPSVPPTIK